MKSDGLTERFQLWAKAQRKPQWRVFFVCLIISCFIWTLRAFSKDYIASEVVQVEFTQLPDSFVFLNAITPEVYIDYESHGFSLIGKRLFSKSNPLKVNLTKQNIREGKMRIPTSRFNRQIKSSLGQDRELISLEPDSIEFTISKIIKKTIPILPMYQEVQGEGFFLKSAPIASPKSVIAVGPKAILDTLTRVYTDIFEVGNSSDSMIVELIPPMGVNSLSIPSCKVEWNLDEWIEHSINVEITSNQFPSGFTPNFLPDSVKVSFLVGKNQINNLSKEDFLVEVNAKEDDWFRERTKLNVELVEFPANLRNISYNPSRVEFILIEDK